LEPELKKRGIPIWRSAWRKFYATAALILGHLIWVTLGRQFAPMWRATVIFFAAPIDSAAAKLEAWRFDKSQKATSLEAAQRELDSLRSEVADLRLERQLEKERVLEAGDALDVLGLKRLLPPETQTARVVANNRNAPHGGIIIDMGKDRGLVEDQGVICADGGVGRIWKVGVTQSVVLPLDTYNSSTGVMLARSRATGVLQGIDTGLAVIRYISNQETVQVGEPVYTSNMDNVFPKGMLIGHVSEASPGPLEMNIVVTVAAPLDRLGFLFVLPSSVSLELGTEIRGAAQDPARGGR
jgi:rod shape-determining protein MreC